MKKNKTNDPENCLSFFYLKFTFCFPISHKTFGGWVGSNTSSTNASFGAKTDVAKYFEYCLFFSMEEVIASPRLIGGDFPIVELEDKGSKRSRRSRPYYTELP